MDGERHWIVWDGECGFCRRAADWAIARDGGVQFAAVPYQEVLSPPMTPALRAACARAVHVRTRDGVWLRGGRACLFVLERVGYARFARISSRAPLVWVIEFAYRLVAGNRTFFSRLAGRSF